MKRIKNKELIARLTEIYARDRKGQKKEGIEMKNKDWFSDDGSQSYYLRVLDKGGNPTTYIHTIPYSSIN